MASSSNDGTVNIWEPNTWSSFRVYKGHTAMLYGLDQIDEDTIVSGSADFTIQIWKISTGVAINTINVSAIVHTVRSLLNSNLIVCGLAVANDSLRVYEYSTGNLVKPINIGYVYSIEILNEQYMASAGIEHNIIIWDLTTYSINKILKANMRSFNYLKSLPKHLLASASADNSIFIWNWSNGNQILTLMGHTGQLGQCSLDLLDNEILISGSYDQTIRLWNITNGALIQTIETDMQINALAVFKMSKLRLVGLAGCCFKKSIFFIYNTQHFMCYV